jgi:predicted dehydrogenase
VYLVRASCQGDLLSDGTHAVDSVRWLLGDEPAVWVLGQVFRMLPGRDAPDLPEFQRHTGFRFGHPVESGSFGVVQFESGVRAEIMTGRAVMRGRPYQDYEICGTEGRLRRPGDKGNLQISDRQEGGWRDVSGPVAPNSGQAMATAWREFARLLRDGGDHPLLGDNALKDHELVMAIYESARISKQIHLPLNQDAFPLQRMIEQGRA